MKSAPDKPKPKAHTKQIPCPVRTMDPCSRSGRAYQADKARSIIIHTHFRGHKKRLHDASNGQSATSVARVTQGSRLAAGSPRSLLVSGRHALGVRRLDSH